MDKIIFIFLIFFSFEVEAQTATAVNTKENKDIKNIKDWYEQSKLRISSLQEVYKYYFWQKHETDEKLRQEENLKKTLENNIGALTKTSAKHTDDLQSIADDKSPSADFLRNNWKGQIDSLKEKKTLMQQELTAREDALNVLKDENKNYNTIFENNQNEIIALKTEFKKYLPMLTDQSLDKSPPQPKFLTNFLTSEEDGATVGKAKLTKAQNKIIETYANKIRPDSKATDKYDAKYKAFLKIEASKPLPPTRVEVVNPDLTGKYNHTLNKYTDVLGIEAKKALAVDLSNKNSTAASKEASITKTNVNSKPANESTDNSDHIVTVNNQNAPITTTTTTSASPTPVDCSAVLTKLMRNSQANPKLISTLYNLAAMKAAYALRKFNENRDKNHDLSLEKLFNNEVQKNKREINSFYEKFEDNLNDAELSQALVATSKKRADVTADIKNSTTSVNYSSIRTRITNETSFNFMLSIAKTITPSDSTSKIDEPTVADAYIVKYINQISARKNSSFNAGTAKDNYLGFTNRVNFYANEKLEKEEFDAKFKALNESAMSMISNTLLTIADNLNEQEFSCLQSSAQEPCSSYMKNNFETIKTLIIQTELKNNSSKKLCAVFDDNSTAFFDLNECASKSSQPNKQRLLISTPSQSKTFTPGKPIELRNNNFSGFGGGDLGGAGASSDY